jgi:hypothetical protein
MTVLVSEQEEGGQHSGLRRRLEEVASRHQGPRIRVAKITANDGTPPDVRVWRYDDPTGLRLLLDHERTQDPGPSGRGFRGVGAEGSPSSVTFRAVSLRCAAPHENGAKATSRDQQLKQR